MPESSRGLFYRVDSMVPPWEVARRPVVFHHGIGTDHGIWALWAQILAGRHPVLRFDMRGAGASPVPVPDHHWTMAELVEDLWDVVDEATSGSVHLVGESMGGTVVLAAALARPERVVSVQIMNGTYKGAGLGEIERWQAQFADGTEAWSARMMQNRFAPGVLQPQATDWFEQTQRRTPAHVALGLGTVLAGTDLTDALSGFDKPLSVVLPDSSPFVPVSHGEELCDLLPQARLRVVPGTRHGLPFSHAETEAPRLVDFLAGIEREAAPG